MHLLSTCYNKEEKIRLTFEKEDKTCNILEHGVNFSGICLSSTNIR